MQNKNDFEFNLYICLKLNLSIILLGKYYLFDHLNILINIYYRTYLNWNIKMNMSFIVNLKKYYNLYEEYNLKYYSS
jgi:hypothetical protein